MAQKDTADAIEQAPTYPSIEQPSTPAQHGTANRVPPGLRAHADPLL